MLLDDVCLVPGAPVVRVESAPGNARRIFTGIDILAEGCDVLELVWATLTDYDNLDKVVPNLVSNTVVRRDEDARGARLKQVGGAKLAPGITFTAQTTLDVREYPEGLPKSMEADYLSADESAGSKMTQGARRASAAARAFGSSLPLTWDMRPLELPPASHLPTSYLPTSYLLPPTSYLPTSYLLPPTSYLLPPTSLLPTSCLVVRVSRLHRIYESFDNLMLLHQGGIAYFGHRAEAVAYFSGLGITCPTHYNPADFLITTLMTHLNHEGDFDESDETALPDFLEAYSTWRICIYMQYMQYMSCGLYIYSTWRTCTHACTRTLHACTHACTRTLHACTHARMHTCMHTCTCTHAYARTQMQSARRSWPCQ